MRLISAVIIYFLVIASAPNISAGDALQLMPPNIIVILADDLGFGDVHTLNPTRGKIPTPNLDRLASQGMAFTDTHGGSSVCTPTRYGLLTGRYAWRTHLESGVLDGYVKPLIAADRLTVPALLKKSGYHTACIGKWHLGFTIEGAGKNGGGEGGAPVGAVTNDGPVTRGFDTYIGFHHARMIGSLFRNDRVSEIVNPIDMLPLLTQEGCSYVAARAQISSPFFLYLALNSPHTPIVPSKEWQGKSGLGDYGDFVMQTDAAIGEVLSALDRTGVAKRTLVVVTSDNGCSPAAGVEKLEKQGHFPSADLRGYKSDIWDGGHRVPFFVRWPEVVKPGTRCTQLICLTDLLATCAELVGAHLPDSAGEDSVSLLPLLRGGDDATRQSVIHHSINGCFGIRDGQWKLEFCPGSGGWGKPKDADAKKNQSPIQLYDMASDPGETHNVQGDHADIVARLTTLLERSIAEGRSTPGNPQKNDRDIDYLHGSAKVKE